MDVANTQAVLTQLFDRFGVEPMRLHIGKPFIGKGVFSTDGAYWQHSRNLIKPMFARAQVSDFTALDLHLSRMMNRIPQDGSTIDLQVLFKLMFLDHSTEFLFGESAETQLTGSPDAVGSELLTIFDAALSGLGKRILLGRLRVLFLWDRSYDRLASSVHAIVDHYIDKAISREDNKKELQNRFPEKFKRYIILDDLLKTVQDRVEIRNHIINIFLPGRDATAIGLSGVCFLLARHPYAWHKLRAEVLSLKGFRLLMPANRNMRLCLKDCVLPSGGGPDGKKPIFVPQGTQVSVNFGAMQRDKDIWGEDADEFRPERWEDMKTGWHYIPFSGGPRICPGQQIALTECAYVLVRLMQNFRAMENRDPEMAFIEQSRLTVESRNGVKVALIPL
ncbi:MAG: hypothetical protein M1827_002733 [Pycnora praestabilis]|nr:MAG: hypothetical protein M1827_002733 [Pycnora praestabilis]